MAKGKKCPQCGYYMYVVEERPEPKGSWVVYECRSRKCTESGPPFREKVFEDK